MEEMPDKSIEPEKPATTWLRKHSKPFQYSIRTLLIVTTVVAVLLAIGTQVRPVYVNVLVFGWLVCVFLIGLFVWKKMLRWPVGVFSALFLALVLVLLSYGMKANLEIGKSAECNGKIHHVGRALHNYHSDKGHFPPAYIADENGKPMHSWRMLILPYLGDGKLKEIYDKYNFGEPWNGPNNSKLHDIVPRDGGRLIFHCPLDNSPATTTSFVVVVGPDTMWPGNKTIQYSDVTDAEGSTILVVEMVNSGIHWMEPQDLHVTQMNPKINPKMGKGISCNHGSVPAVFGDGGIRTLPNDLAPETLRALLTISGGEDVSEFFD